jgi:type I restriction enzyme R subunit
LFDPDARKAFYEAYKDIEALWEILSPSPELRDHLTRMLFEKAQPNTV